MMRVIVLGGTGFIGQSLVKEFIKRDDIELTIYTRSLNEDIDKKVNVVIGDYKNIISLKEAMTGQDIVYNLISGTIPSSSWNNPQIEVNENLIHFINFIEIANEAGIKKICFASSGGTVYGLQDGYLTESDPLDPFSPYGIIKRTKESFLKYAQVKYNIAFDIFRISNVYGEGQDIGKGLGFINTSLENIKNRKPVLIYGDGENIRDYIYVQDVAKLLMLSIDKDLNQSEIYNVGMNLGINLNDLLLIFKNVVNADFEVIYLPSRKSDNKKVILDNSRIMQLFPEFKITSLEEGIKNTYQYIINKIN